MTTDTVQTMTTQTETEMWESRLAGELHHQDRYVARQAEAWKQYVEAVAAVERAGSTYVEAVARYERMQERIAYIELQIAERA